MTPDRLIYQTALGEVLRRLRGERTQADAARQAGVSQATVSKLESGTRRADMVLVGAMAAAYGVSAAHVAILVRDVQDGAERAVRAAAGRDLSRGEMAHAGAVRGAVECAAALVFAREGRR
jgi:transcriptional regulator with XRE-family HTH domain